jgi:hypothetical protein
MAFATALIFYEGRGTTFFNDEWILFERMAGDFDLETIITPFNGHLIGVGSLVFDGGLAAFGPEPVAFRAIGILTLLALSYVLYAYLRRLISPWLALVPAAIILFLGASWEVLLWSMSLINTAVSIGAGVGALVALERPGRKADFLACTLLVVGVAAGTYALAFVVGAIVLVLARSDRWAHAWIVIVPLTLYAAWWVWAQRFDQESSLELVNVWLFPAVSLESLAAALAALAGLSPTLAGDGSLNPTIEIDAGWGRILAVAALVGLGFRFARGRLPAGFWAATAALLTFWAMITLGFGPDRAPEESRYILPAAVLVALVAGQALAGVRIPRPAAIVVAIFALVAIASGIRQLHDGSVFLRDYSDRARAALAGIEDAPSADHDYVPVGDPALTGIVPAELPITAGPYLAAERDHGSPAFTRAELREQPAEIQDVAERVRTAAIAADTGVPPP